MQAVLNTLAAARGPLRDGLELRRAAVERRIPCFTRWTPPAWRPAPWRRRPAVDGYHFDVRPLREYLRGPAQRS